MIFERGPFAFVDGAVKFVRKSVVEGSPMQHLFQSASVYMSERIAVLAALRCSLATFLAQVCLCFYQLEYLIICLIFYHQSNFFCAHILISFEYYCTWDRASILSSLPILYYCLVHSS